MAGKRQHGRRFDVANSARRLFAAAIGVTMLATGMIATTASPSGADPLPSTPMLTTKGVILENDNSTSGPDGNTQLAGANQNVTSFPQNNRLTVRAQIENSGGALTEATKLALFYDRGDGNWSKVQSTPTVATAAGNCADGQMVCTDIETAGYSGVHSANAIDNNNTPWVAYYDTTNGNLRAAKYVGTGGTGCASTAWICTNVDTTGDVGQENVIAIAPDNKPWISFYDATNMNLRVAKYVGTGGTGCASTAWTCTNVDTTGDRGHDTAIDIDNSGTAWISYSDRTNGDLRVAKYVGSGGTGCASAQWTCTAVATNGNQGMYGAIALDPQGRPWVSHYKFDNGDLGVARYVGTGGSGCASAQWTCTTVDTTNDTGFYSSIAFDPQGAANVAYYDNQAEAVKTARFVGANGTGCATNTWSCKTVDTDPAGDTGKSRQLRSTKPARALSAISTTPMAICA